MHDEPAAEIQLMKSRSIQLDVKINEAKLRRKISEASRKLNIKKDEIIRRAGVAFVQSVITKTPESPKNRGIITEDKAGRYDAKLGVAYGARREYKVPYRTARKRGRKFFKDLQAAKEFAKIKFRGIGKGGWLYAAMKLKAPIGFKPSPEVLSKLNVTGGFEENKGAWKYSIRLINKSFGISEFGLYAANQALRIARTRLNHMMKNDLKKGLK